MTGPACKAIFNFDGFPHVCCRFFIRIPLLLPRGSSIHLFHHGVKRLLVFPHIACPVELLLL